MYKCEYFKVHELVPPHVYNARGEKAWELLDEQLLRTLDRLRQRYGPMTINNYLWGKNLSSRAITILTRGPWATSLT